MGHYIERDKWNELTKQLEDSMNKITLMGRIGSEIEKKNVGSNTLAKFSVATNEKWKDKSGVAQEKTSWHNITIWGKSADYVETYAEKGSRIIVEGKIDYRQWEKADGGKGYATDIIASNVSIIDFKAKDSTKSSQPTMTSEDIPF